MINFFVLQRRKLSTERLDNLLKTTQVLSDRGRIDLLHHTQFHRVPSYYSGTKPLEALCDMRKVIFLVYVIDWRGKRTEFRKIST